mgnify:CR=1 FL=1
MRMVRRLLPVGITRRVEAAAALTAFLAVVLSTGAGLPLLLAEMREREAAQVNAAAASVSRALSEASQALQTAAGVAALDPALAQASTSRGPRTVLQQASLANLAAAASADMVVLEDSQGRIVAQHLRYEDHRSKALASVLSQPQAGERGIEFVACDADLALHAFAPLLAGGRLVGRLHLLSRLADRVALGLPAGLPPGWEVFFVAGGQIAASSAPELFAGARLAQWRGKRPPLRQVSGTVVLVTGPRANYEAVLFPLWGRGQVAGFWGLAVPAGAQVPGLSGLVRALLIIAAASVLLAVVVGRWQARFITAGLARLSHQVNRVRLGDLEIAKAEGPPQDEVAVVASALAEMADQLKRSFAELRAERHKVQSLVDRMAEGVLVIDAEQKVVFLNPTLRKMLSLIEAEQQVPFAELPAELQEGLKGVLQEGREREMEMQPAAAAGRYFRVRLAPVPVVPGTGGAMAVLTDVTPYHELDEMKTDFIGYVAHELRSPLTVIKGFAELLQSTGESMSQDYREMLQAVSLHSDRLNGLVESLLELTRLEAGAPLVLSKEPVELDKMLVALVALYRAYASGHEFVLELPEEALCLEGDPDRVGLIFSNLLSNAIKYTPPGTRVMVRGRAQEAAVVVEVADNGPGIPAEHLRNIFDKFYRAPSPVRQKKRGSGIGLYLVKRLAEAHGGTVTVSSTLEQGTSFTVRLPRGSPPVGA